MKRIVLFLAAALMTAGMLPMTASAHGGHGHRRQASQTYQTSAACTVNDCEAIGPHLHDDAWYCTHTGASWSDYKACSQDGCAASGLHEHDGQWYHCASYPEGGVNCGSGCQRNCG